MTFKQNDKVIYLGTECIVLEVRLDDVLIESVDTKQRYSAHEGNLQFFLRYNNLESIYEHGFTVFEGDDLQYYPFGETLHNATAAPILLLSAWELYISKLGETNHV